jgi:putative PIN family toxin of toxin-antitoxin system
VQEKRLDLVLSTDILDEYIRVGNILSKKYAGVNINDIIDLVIKRSKVFNVPPLLNSVCRDIDDDKFIACALATDIKVIVSGDLDLLELDGYQNIHVIKPRNFVDSNKLPSST